MKQRIIALLTDFGYTDGYVASMKGVMLSINPNVHIVDISHNIKAQSVDDAAYVIWSAYKYFPKSTIFVCVVDPGVGSERKILCVETQRYIFLAPDNGVLKYILASERIKRIINVENKHFFLRYISSTFHGRDIFAPVATYISNNEPISKLGCETSPTYGACSFVNVGEKKLYYGTVIHIDTFGNVITNFFWRFPKYKKVALRIRRRTITDFYKTYAEAKSKEPFLIIGSSGLVELSIKNGNAGKFLKATLNQKVSLVIE